MRITIKQGDTRHAIRALLKTVDGIPIDLSNAKVRFLMASRRGPIVLNNEATVEVDGKVHYVFTDGETDVTGFYEAEFLVTYDDMRVETFPHQGKISITIENRLGGI